MNEERNIITTDSYSNITMPTGTDTTTMSEWELCELFGVTASTVRAGIKALCKSGVLREYEIMHHTHIGQMQCGGLQP